MTTAYHNINDALSIIYKNQSFRNQKCHIEFCMSFMWEIQIKPI